MAPIYSTTGKSTGMGRDGATAIEDSDLKLDLSRPGQGEGTNPEQLFAMGYAACFHSAMKSVGSAQKLSTKDSTVTATVDMFKDEDGPGFSLGVKLHAHVPKLSGEEAQRLVEAAHQVCPYSNATRGNIPVEVSAA